jgi:hypothetical protein
MGSRTASAVLTWGEAILAAVEAALLLAGSKVVGIIPTADDVGGVDAGVVVSRYGIVGLLGAVSRWTHWRKEQGIYGGRDGSRESSKRPRNSREELHGVASSRIAVGDCCLGRSLREEGGGVVGENWERTPLCRSCGEPSRCAVSSEGRIATSMIATLRRERRRQQSIMEDANLHLRPKG